MAGFPGKPDDRKLQNFGYIDIELKNDCMLGKAKDRLTGHEFHKSITVLSNPDTVYSIKKTKGDAAWSGGYRYKNVLAGYPPISFLGNMNSFLSMLDYADSRGKGGR